MKSTKRQKEKAERKINRAIDCMIDLKSDGFGCDAIERVLEMLNQLRNQITS